MHVQVRFFASLRERVGVSDQSVELLAPASVAGVWNQSMPDVSMPANILAARNMEYVKLDVMVEDGDEIAFFPPVTGGAYARAEHVS